MILRKDGFQPSWVEIHEHQTVNKEEDGYQILVKKAHVPKLDILSKKRLQLINVYPKQCMWKRTTLLHPNGTPNEVWYSVHCGESTKEGLVEAHDSRNKKIWDIYVSKPLEHGLPRNQVKRLLKVNDAAEDFQRTITRHIHDGSD